MSNTNISIAPFYVKTVTGNVIGIGDGCIQAQSG
jgi:hypothetical protein